MSRRSSAVPAAPRSTRWLAAFLAVTVWALGLLAVSPELHAALHNDSGDHAHECAVTLFAHGADTLGTAPALHDVADARVLGYVPAARPCAVEAPHYWHRPACGPPLC